MRHWQFRVIALTQKWVNLFIVGSAKAAEAPVTFEG
jgi:hypothetical protein